MPRRADAVGRAGNAPKRRSRSPARRPGVVTRRHYRRQPTDCLARLAAYERVCGFPTGEPDLPVTYPHVLGFP
ncbi:hypothetical protein ABZ575_40215, partial [Streptomyces sp. NPDC018347]